MLRKLLIALLALGFVLGLALLAIALLIDPNDYRDAVGERLTVASGRAVEIEGDVTLGFSWQPELRFGGLRVANAPWGSAPDMLWVEEAAAQLAFWPLLRGEVRIRRLTVDGMVLLLERHRDGRANWEFVSDQSAQAIAKDGDDRDSRPWPEVGEVRVRDLEFRLRDDLSGRDEAFGLHSLELHPEQALGTTGVAFVLDYRGAELTGAGEMGSLRTLAGLAPWPLDLELHWGGMSFAVRGHLDLPDLSDLDLLLAGEIADLAAVGARFDLNVPTLPVTFDARLRGGSQQYRLDDLSMTLGGSDLAGSLSFEPGADRAQVALRSRRIDLDAWRRPALTTAPPAPLFGADPWPEPLLPALTASFSWEVASFSVGGFSFTAMQIEGDLQADRVLAATVAGELADGVLLGTVELRQQAEGVEGLAEMRLSNGSLGLLLQQAPLASGIGVDVDVALEARASGGSPADFASSLDGHLSLLGGQGRIQHRALETLSSDLLGSLMPFIEQQDSAALNCLAGRFDFKDGVAEDGMILFDSQTVTLAGRGRVDLGSESVAMVLTPRPKRAGLMNLAVPLEVVGPLRSPEVRPESGGLARRTAGVALAVVNPLVLLVPVVTTTLGGAENPCLAAIEEARTGQRGAEPESRVEGFMRGLRRFMGGDG